MAANFNSKRELKKLREITKNLSDDKREICEGLISDAAFMAEQLEILRDHIQKNGWYDEYKNGREQYGRKTSVEAEAYMKMQKLYQSVIKQLTDLLPDTKADGIAKAGDALAGFVLKGKNIELR